MKEEINDFFNKQSVKVKKKIRSMAVNKAEENCIKYGTKIDELSLDEWKKIVAQEEEEIIKRAWRFGGIGAIAFGFMPWW
tara:strand:- start:478 stop:717 length:240 start_codon:yes stop_codon:yes gene_type:complete